MKDDGHKNLHDRTLNKLYNNKFIVLFIITITVLYFGLRFTNEAIKAKNNFWNDNNLEVPTSENLKEPIDTTSIPITKKESVEKNENLKKPIITTSIPIIKKESVEKKEKKYVPKRPEIKSDQHYDNKVDISMYTISGIIQNNDGKRVDNVSISAEGSKSSVSDKIGKFEIDVKFKDINDQVKLTFFKTGYKSSFKYINRSESPTIILEHEN